MASAVLFWVRAGMPTAQLPDSDTGGRPGAPFQAESARASRRRKKMYIQDLESQVARLTERISQLQVRLFGYSGARAALPSVR